VRRVERLQLLDIVEDFMQGLRARGFQEDSSLGKASGKGKSSNQSKGKCREAAIESLQECRRLVRG
jgi:hypothetical protein